MTLDIRGGLKNTTMNQSDYVVFEELLSNAIDSYLIRLSVNKKIPDFVVKFEISISTTDLLQNEFEVSVNCEENGYGFGDSQVKAFVTKDSTYKDQLQIQGIGKCKGAGRIQFFHHFKNLEIESTFTDGIKTTTRSLKIDENCREISQENFTDKTTPNNEILTRICLSGYRPHATLHEKAADNTSAADSFSAPRIRHHLYTSFLQRLVVLKSIVGHFEIIIESSYSASDTLRTEKECIESNHLPQPTEQVELPLLCTHAREQNAEALLRLTRYSFLRDEFPSFEHEIALCANSAVVQPITKRYLKHVSERQRATCGNYELILIEGDILEENVNQQRDGFNLPALCSETKAIGSEFSIEDIIESIEDYVFNIITPNEFDKDALIRSTESKFGITRQMLDESNVKIHYGDDEESIATRVLKKLQEDIVGDTSNLFNVKDELLKLDPRSSDFRLKINELSWKYTSTIKKMDMTNLSQLIVRRTAMLEVLRHAVDKLLICQENQPGRRNENERVIHNVFFPTGKDSTETADHDIWLLNEEYQYFEYIASDKPLKSLRWPDGTRIFESDIDESLATLFSKNNKEHEGKRPDIALFTQEGAAIIIEFKAPDVEIQEHIPDLAQYARLLAAKSNGRIKKFYGYLVGCKLDPSRMVTGWTRFANSKGYFSTGKLVDEENDKVYGEIYSELLFYQQFIERASLRLDIYKRKLKVNLD